MTIKRTDFIYIQQNTPTSTGGEMNAILIPSQWVVHHSKSGLISPWQNCFVR